MAPPTTTTNTRLTRELVLALLPALKDDPLVLRQVTDHIAKEVKADVQGSSRMTWPEVGSSIAGLARTARVRIQSDLADGLEKAVEVLARHKQQGQAAWEGDMPVKMSNLSQHVQFLLAMANQPSLKTHEFAYDYLHRQPAQVVDHDRILYDEIMADPFDGPHWGEGYDSEVREGWTDSEDGDEDASSSDKERIITPAKRRVSPVLGHQAQEIGEDQAEIRLREVEEMMRELEAGAYWKRGGEVVQPVKVGQGWREISTGSDVASLAASLDESIPLGRKAISGVQFQRELMFALSGRPGVMFDFDAEARCFTISDHPTVTHYTPAAVENILSNVQTRATQASSLRLYVSRTLCPVTSSTTTTPSKTSQAFAEACRVYIAKFDSWIAELEMMFVRGPNPGAKQICTPLSLRLETDERFGIMLDCLSASLSCADDDTPNRLLNALYSILENTATHRAELLQIFIASAAPLWGMLGDWLVRGMPIPRSLIDFDSQSEDERNLDAEFWIKRDQDISWADEDFWESAFLLPQPNDDGGEEDGRPSWIEREILELVLEAGKARGLLRGLLGRDADDAGGQEPWVPLETVLSGSLASSTDRSSVDLVDSVSSYLRPICQLTTVQLRRTLDEDCGLQAHLDAIDGLFYMRGYSVLQPWNEWLFSQVISRKPWADFQNLTNTFREMVEKQSEMWLNPHAVRIHTTKRIRHESTATISPDTLSIIKVNYQVPFPLSQLFTSTSLDLRADVFGFLMQVVFAKNLLATTKEYEPHKSEKLDEDMLILLQARHRLVWIVNVIWTWITERVIDLETDKYKARLDHTSSFGDMIKLELKHVRQMREFAFQHARTTAINESVSNILESTATLHDLFVAYAKQAQAATTSSDSPPPPPTTYIQGRSRRRRRLAESRRGKANLDPESDSESDSDPDTEGKQVSANRTLGHEPSFVEQGLRDRVKAMIRDLEAKVRVLRDGVEELARGEEGDEGQAEVWGMLDFALEDWR